MNRRWLVLAPLLLVSACGGGADAAGAASCVGPQLVSLSPQHGPARTSISLTVEWLNEGCHDTNEPSDERPRTAALYFHQQQTETLLGSMTGAGPRYTATLRVEVPARAVPGPAVLYLGSEHQVIGHFTVGEQRGSALRVVPPCLRPPLALVHRLHARDRDRVPLGDQIGR